MKIYMISKPVIFAKIFFLISLSGFIIYIILALYTYHTAYFTIAELQKIEKELQKIEEDVKKIPKGMKYVLLWTNKKTYPFKYLLEGNESFINQNCSFTNCFITERKGYLNDNYTNFDAVLFNSKDLRKWKPKIFPKYRSDNQLYVFVGKESADTYPICNIKADYYFNWTWTYKLNSDIVSSFIEIRNLNGTIIGPGDNVKWETETESIPAELRHKLRSKTKAVAWLSSKCLTRNNRINYVKSLKNYLKFYNLKLDMFGPCGTLACPNNSLSECYRMIEKDYYFYVAFEDSSAEDYVTEEVLKAFHNYAVPLVLGGPDYSKFLPPGSYIEMRDEKSMDSVVANIDYAIRNPSVYYKYFEWRNHYTFHEVEGLGNVCELCKLLNNNDIKFSVYAGFRGWWYPHPLKDRCYPVRNQPFNYTRVDFRP